MASISIKTLREAHPGLNDKQAAAACAKKDGWSAVVGYSQGSEPGTRAALTNVGLCKDPADMQRYLDLPWYTEVLYEKGREPSTLELIAADGKIATFTISPDAADWLVEHLRREPDGLVTILRFADGITEAGHYVQIPGGVLDITRRFPNDEDQHAELGCVKVLIEPQTLERLEGKHLVLDSVVVRPAKGLRPALEKKVLRTV